MDSEEEENDQKRMGAAHQVASSNMMDIEESEALAWMHWHWIP